MCQCKSHSPLSSDTSRHSSSDLSSGLSTDLPPEFPGDALPAYDNNSPAYESSLEFYGTSLLKTEFDTPWTNHSTSFQPVVLELNSNQLNVYEFRADKTTINTLKALYKFQNYDNSEVPKPCAEIADEYFFDADAYGDVGQPEKNYMIFSKLKKRLSSKRIRKYLAYPLPPQFYNNALLLEPTSDAGVYRKFAKKYRGALMRSFTLSNSTVGEALSSSSTLYKEDRQNLKNSYTLINYRNTLRVRIEYSQMLLHCWSFHGMIHWYRNLTVGRDLCTPIDERRDTMLKSIPRNFTVANNNLLAMSAREALTFNPETRKLVHRDSMFSVESDDCSCFSDNSTISAQTRASSVCSKSDACSRSSAVIHGSRVVCYENYYTAIEKQFISNCIPVLNSYDKWQGSRLTISDYKNLLPLNDRANLNVGEKIFISHATFESLVRQQRKQATTKAKRECKDFFVAEAGLVGIAA